MSFVIGVLMGLAYVLPPGPVTVETVRRSLGGGVRPALAVQLGAVLGDLTYALLVLGGLGGFLLRAEVQSGLGLVGSATLVLLGAATLRDVRSIGAQAAAAYAGHRAGAAGGARALAGHAAAGLALGLANPYAVVFWLAVGGGALHGSPAALGGFAAGSLLASVATALAAGQLHRRRWRRAAAWVSGGCGAALLLLGLQLGLSTLGRLWAA